MYKHPTEAFSDQEVFCLACNCFTIVFGCLLFITLAPVNKNLSLSEGTLKEAIAELRELAPLGYRKPDDIFTFYQEAGNE